MEVKNEVPKKEKVRKNERSVSRKVQVEVKVRREDIDVCPKNTKRKKTDEEGEGKQRIIPLCGKNERLKKQRWDGESAGKQKISRNSHMRDNRKQLGGRALEWR